MATGISHRTSPARARRQTILKTMSPEDRTNFRKINAIICRADLKRDDAIRRGLDRLIRNARRGDDRFYVKVLQQVIRLGEERGLLLSAAKRREAEKGGAA